MRKGGTRLNANATIGCSKVFAVAEEPNDVKSLALRSTGAHTDFQPAHQRSPFGRALSTVFCMHAAAKTVCRGLRVGQQQCFQRGCMHQQATAMVRREGGRGSACNRASMSSASPGPAAARLAARRVAIATLTSKPVLRLQQHTTTIRHPMTAPP